MTPAIANIPLAILIFDNDGQILYRAFSPNNYNTIPGLPENDNTFPDQYGQFMARIYNRISYQQGGSNSTQYGKLKEIHTRYIDTPLSQRTTNCYFTTYVHPHTIYRPVHRQSPVFFDFQGATSYAAANPDLIHRSCEHEFV
jgi:hypothetical protein